jgi:hypothetical protein
VRHDADASSEPCCSRDQKQPCPDDDGPDGSCDALTGRCETSPAMAAFTTAIARRTPMTQEDRRQSGTAVAAVEAEAQAVSPGRAGVGRQRTAAPGCLPATKVTRLPRGEPERAGDQDDPANRDRNGARQRRLPHLDRRERDAQRKRSHPEHGSGTTDLARQYAPVRRIARRCSVIQGRTGVRKRSAANPRTRNTLSRSGFSRN